VSKQRQAKIRRVRKRRVDWLTERSGDELQIRRSKVTTRAKREMYPKRVQAGEQWTRRERVAQRRQLHGFNVIDADGGLEGDQNNITSTGAAVVVGEGVTLALFVFAFKVEQQSFDG
jgi:hypothetical protein